MSALLRLAVAFLMALIGLGAAPGPSHAATDSVVHHYTYGSADTSSTLPHAETERGPPIICDHAITPVSVDVPSRSSTACLKTSAFDAHTAYNTPVLLAQVDSARTTTPEPFQSTDGDLSPLHRSVGAAKAAPEIKSGIYAVNSADGVYVGQSSNITRRLAQHVASGKFTADEVANAARQGVTGGRTAREIAEQTMIDRMGGIDNLLNLVNPIGPRRFGLMPNQPYWR